MNVAAAIHLAAPSTLHNTAEPFTAERAMLSYRHAFHAGNYADVLKHTLLVQILRYLTQKDKPLCYLDTHAGAGLYRLGSAEAAKTGEFQQGIGALWSRADLPAAVAEYRDAVRAASGDSLNLYPGSPWLAWHLLRPEDRIELCELHPADQRYLQRTLGGYANVRIHEEDGWAKSLALMPPRERRGLVLIDPSYEIKDEYLRVVELLQQLHRRFATGVYAIWYPIADAERTALLLRRLRQTGLRRIQQFELGRTRDHRQPGMTGTGMLVINPPWQLASAMAEALPFLANCLGDGAYWHQEELAGE